MYDTFLFFGLERGVRGLSILRYRYETIPVNSFASFEEGRKGRTKKGKEWKGARKERTRGFFSYGNNSNSNSKDKNKNTATYIESGRERGLGLGY